MRESETRQEVDKFSEKGLHLDKKKNLSYVTAYFKAFHLISEKMTALTSAGLVNTDLPLL